MCFWKSHDHEDYLTNRVIPHFIVGKGYVAITKKPPKMQWFKEHRDCFVSRLTVLKWNGQVGRVPPPRDHSGTKVLSMLLFYHLLGSEFVYIFESGL